LFNTITIVNVIIIVINDISIKIARPT